MEKGEGSGKAYTVEQTEGRLVGKHSGLETAMLRRGLVLVDVLILPTSPLYIHVRKCGRLDIERPRKVLAVLLRSIFLLTASNCSL